MPVEHFIMLVTTAFSIATVFYIPREKMRLALVSFHAFQTLTWAGHLYLTQNGSIDFPVRLFARATRGGILFNFVLFPMIFVWFILLFPYKAGLMKKLFHHAFFISLIVWFIRFIGVYTQLQNFLKGTAMSQIIRLYINFALYFVLCQLFLKWFTKKTGISGGG